MPRKKKSSEKKVSSSKSNSTDITDTSESNKSDVSLSEKSNSSKSSTKSATDKKKKTKRVTKRQKSKKKKDDDYVVIKADPEELKKSLSYNITKKEAMNKSEYDTKFNNLRDKYIKLCKEFSQIQNQLKEKDNEREVILKEIRELQKQNSDVITNELNLDNNSEEKKPDKESKKEKNVSKPKGKAKGSVNLIDRYKKSSKNIILKPLRDTDMETDDSESEELSESESSESDVSDN